MKLNRLYISILVAVHALIGHALKAEVVSTNDKAKLYSWIVTSRERFKDYPSGILDAQRLYSRLSLQAILNFNSPNSGSKTTSLEGLFEELTSVISDRSTLSPDLERRINADVKILNQQIDLNEKLRKEGKYEVTQFIVDLRKANQQPAFLEDPKVAAVNTKLQEINKSVQQTSGSSNVAFYVLLNMYFPDSDVSIGSEKREQYLKRYTNELFKRSKLTANGILLNVESFLKAKKPTASQTAQGITASTNLGFTLQYQPFVALGKNLMETSIDQLIQTDLLKLSEQPSLEFAVQGASPGENKDHRGNILDKYVSAIESIIKGKVSEDKNFFASETGGQYFTELKLTATDRTKLLSILGAPNTSPVIKDNLKDYAGVDSYLQRLFGNYYSSISNPLPAGANLKVVTTSDLNTHKGQTAIQLVKEEGIKENTLLLGMHFMKPATETGNVKIRFTVLYGSLFDNYVQQDLDKLWQDVRSLEGSDNLKDAEQKIFGDFIDVLTSIDFYLGKIRIPDSWWKSNEWYAMDPFLAGAINGVLDNLVGILQILTLAGKATLTINHAIFQACLYAYELSKNEAKRKQVIEKLEYIKNNWFPIAKKCALDTIIFFASIDFSNTDYKAFPGFFSGIPADKQIELLAKIEYATTLKDLAISAQPFITSFILDVQYFQAVVITDLVKKGWEKLVVALSDYKEIRYFEGYALIQIASFFVGVGEVVTALRTAKALSTSIRIVDEASSGLRGLRGSFDDIIASFDNLLKTISKAIDKEALAKLRQRLFGKANNIANLLDLPRLKSLTAQTPTGKYLTNLNKSLFNESGYIISKPPSGTITEIIDDIVRNGDGAGEKTESIIDLLMTSKGYQRLDGKYGSNNGFDHVFIKQGENINNPSEILVMESKQFKHDVISEFDEIANQPLYDATSGTKLNGPNQASGLPTQMSDDWIFVHVQGKLIDTNVQEKVDLAVSLLTNRSKVIKYVTAVDKSTGEINFLKLSTF